MQSPSTTVRRIVLSALAAMLLTTGGEVALHSGLAATGPGSTSKAVPAGCTVRALTPAIVNHKVVARGTLLCNHRQLFQFAAISLQRRKNGNWVLAASRAQGFSVARAHVAIHFKSAAGTCVKGTHKYRSALLINFPHSSVVRFGTVRTITC